MPSVSYDPPDRGPKDSGPPPPDAVDRLLELLRLAIDCEKNIASRISKAADKVFGYYSPDTNEAKNPSITAEPTVANLLDDLERAQSATLRQLDRFRETKI